MKRAKREKIKKKRGITLVALVITIIILIILATVAINYAFGDNGLVRMAEKASEYYLNDSTYTDQSLKNIEDYIDNILAGKGNSTVNNPYVEEEWTYAYVCNDGVWDNTQYTAGQQVEGDIIAKFYVTEITICDGITNIGNLAFAGDTSLNKITISNSVENMGTFILLGSSVTSIICTDGTITL